MKSPLIASLFLFFATAFCQPAPSWAQTVTTFYSFSIASPTFNGIYPFAGVTLGSDGNLYGVTSSGGSTDGINDTSGFGTAFKITPSGKATLLHSFGDGTVPDDGTGPESNLVEGSDGDFYGTTANGGSTVSIDTVFGQGYGVAFKMTPSGQVTILHNFGDGSVTNDGRYPDCLIQGADENFYGTTSGGGPTVSSTNVFGSGTVFMMTPSGQVTILHAFGDGSLNIDGSSPNGIVQASDGNFYGTTADNTFFSSIELNGAAFKISPSGQYNVLCTFGGLPYGPLNPVGYLIQGSDGNFYGASAHGGTTNTGSSAPGYGTVFKMTPSGTVTVLHSFGTGYGDGQSPRAGVVQGIDGNLYGTTQFGGTANAGTVYQVIPTGQTKVLHSFEDGSIANDGNEPAAALTPGNDGTFYGTTIAGGTDGTGTIFDLALPPFISNIAPNPVLAGGPNFSLTVSGGFFNPGASVNFNGNTLGTRWASSTQLTAGIPANDIVSAGTAQITVSNPATLYINNPVPTITSLSPSSAAANSGDFTLTINGSGFNSSSTVAFGSDTLTPSSITSSAITVTVPNADLQTSGTVTVTVTNPAPGGGTTSSNFTVTGGTAPTISSLSPPSAVVNSGGFPLTINGTNFTSSSTVTFGSDNLTPASQTATALTVNVPNSDIQSVGAVAVTVTNPGGGGTATANFSVTNSMPAITSLSPSSAIANSGTFTLTINGSGFTSTSVVTFGGNPLTPISQTANAITVSVPNSDIQTVGTVDVSVTNSGTGGGTASSNFSVTNAVPIITSLSPSSTVANSGAFTLTINGSGFMATSSVSFGSNTLTPASVTGTAITVTVPNSDIQNSGTVAVTVTNPGAGGGSASSNFIVANPVPSISYFSPPSMVVNSGPVTLTVNGSGFTQASIVNFGGTVLPLTSVSPGAITVSVPNSLIQIAESLGISVTNPAPGGGTSSASYLVNYTIPTITSLSPSSAVANSGPFTLTINGTGFAQATTVSFGGNALTPTSFTYTAITVTVPNADIQNSGTVAVLVTTPPGAGGGSASANFTITAPNNPAPAITSLSPSSATANSGSFTLTINGSGFLSSSTVSFGGNSLTPTVITSGAITVTVPNADIQTAGSVSVTVTNPSPGGGTATATFTVQAAAPTLQSISLSPTSVTGGSSSTATVTLSGPAPSGGIVVNIASSNTSVATVAGSTITVAQGSKTATFTVSTVSVSSTQSPVISASLQGNTVNATLTVTPSSGGSPPGISSYYINPSYVYGGASAEGTLILTGPVSTDTTVTVTVNNPAATVVGPVVIPAGQDSVNFPVNTIPVSTLTSASVTVYVGSAGKSFGLKIYPPSVMGASVSPNSVVGGSGTSTLTVTLTSAAPAGGCPVTLSSTDSTVLPLSGVTVPAGANSAQLTLSPGSVTASETITITASANGTSAQTKLTVTP